MDTIILKIAMESGKSEAENQELKEEVARLRQELYTLWDFVGQEGMWREAREYVEENKGESVPFGLL